MFRLRSWASSMISVSYRVAVAGDLVEEDAVGHDLDEGVVAGLVGEPDLVADGGAELGAGFLGDALGDGAGGDPSRLGVADLAGDAAAELKADLGQLGGLARPGLAGHDDDLVVPDGLGDVVHGLADRQLCRVADVRDRFAAPGYPAGRPVDLSGQLGDRLVPGGLVAQAAGPVDTPGQPVLVVQHQLGQGAAQVSERGQRGRLVHQRKRVEEENPVVPTLLGPPGFPVTGAARRSSGRGEATARRSRQIGGVSDRNDAIRAGGHPPYRMA